MGINLTMVDLRKRGWTKRLIERFLGQPSATVRNRYNSKSVVRLYDLARVEQVEQSDDWKEAKKVAEKRQQSALWGVVQKRERLKEKVTHAPIQVPAMSTEELRAQAIEHYNLRLAAHAWSSHEVKAPATTNSAPEFLARIEVNFIRHALTRYEELLESTISKEGTRSANSIITRRIYEAIALAYPHLQGECDRQLTRKQVAADYC